MLEILHLIFESPTGGTFSGFMFCFKFLLFQWWPWKTIILEGESRHLLHICSSCSSDLWSSSHVVSYPCFVFFAKKFVVLSCHFRRQRDSEKSAVTSRGDVSYGCWWYYFYSRASYSLGRLDNVDFSPELSNHFFTLLEHQRGRRAIPYPPKVSFSWNVWKRNCFLATFLTPYSYSSFNIGNRKPGTRWGDSVLLVFFAKCLLKVSKVVVGILSVLLKFGFRSDLVGIHSFIIHNPAENLVALTCVESRTALLTSRWVAKCSVNHPRVF